MVHAEGQVQLPEILAQLLVLPCRGIHTDLRFVTLTLHLPKDSLAVSDKNIYIYIQQQRRLYNSQKVVESC